MPFDCNKIVALKSTVQKSRYATVARLVNNMTEFKQLLIEEGLKHQVIGFHYSNCDKVDVGIGMPKWLAEALEI